MTTSPALPCTAAPAVGDTARGYDLGKKNGHLFVWHECLDCRQPRWVTVEGGRPKTQRCGSCAPRRKALDELEACANATGMDRIPARLRRQIEADGATGCWLWTGTRTSGGYAIGNWPLTDDSSLHRTVYEALVGPIPPGMYLDHLCRARHCINPEHLEPVSPRENVLRGLSSGLKTHCAKGHLWTPDNIQWRMCENPPRRKCKTCYEENKRKSAEQRRADRQAARSA